MRGHNTEVSVLTHVLGLEVMYLYVVDLSDSNVSGCIEREYINMINVKTSLPERSDTASIYEIAQQCAAFPS